MHFEKDDGQGINSSSEKGITQSPFIPTYSVLSEKIDTNPDTDTEKDNTATTAAASETAGEAAGEAMRGTQNGKNVVDHRTLQTAGAGSSNCIQANV